MASEIVLVMSADDKYMPGIAGTVKSALSCLGAQRSIKLFVLDGDISDSNKAALRRHWSDPRLDVKWIRFDRRPLRDFVLADYITDATYFRLLAPNLLPPEILKYIYLDSDLLIRRDLGALWDEPLAGSPCLAVQDLGAPFVDSTAVAKQQLSDFGTLVDERPIPNYRDFGISATNPYFNGGLLVVDAALWRKERLCEKMLNILATNREHVTYFDQYALNVALSGRWKPLSPMWNQNSMVFRYKGWKRSKFCKRQFPAYKTDPWIVHFTWRKPWLPECSHPFADEFLRHLDGSPWQLGTRDSSHQRQPAPSSPFRSAWRLLTSPLTRSQRRQRASSLLPPG
jgi:lipopolysaccharide biosynthesis glycosyltransferase